MNSRINKKLQKECIKATMKLRDELLIKVQNMQTSSQQVRLVRFADTLSALLEIKCTLGELCITPVFLKNDLSFSIAKKK